MKTPIRRALKYCHRHKTLTAVVTLAFLAGLIRFLWKIGDFEVYFAAGRRFLLGASIHVVEPNPFTYPTGTALFFVPLTSFGHTVAKSAFFSISFALLLIGIALTNRSVLGPTNQPTRHRSIVFLTALLFSLRYILAAFDNQQTDLIIFGLISVGLYFYQSRSNGAVIAWSIPIVLKANPLFMILLPLFQRRWIVVISLLLLVTVLVLLPDISKYLVKTEAGTTELILPAHVIPRNGEIEQKVFAISPIAKTLLAYLQEYISLNFTNSGPAWWEQNFKNQSLSRIALYQIPLELNANYVFLTLCVVFSIALLFLITRGIKPENVFITGVLFYAAFILIGPQSSKPHFIVIYGLLLYCFQHLSQHFSITRLCFLGAIGVTLGFTSSGFVDEYADQLETNGLIGLTT
ncbi:MAG: glycosyltransferase family 87 protein, partial [Arenicellales bacterium]|nr:glycosyltransferase family 87 protein [Arenicellales bacterium]